MHRDLNLSTSLKPVSWSSGHPTHCAAEQTISGYKIKLAIWGGVVLKAVLLCQQNMSNIFCYKIKKNIKMKQTKGRGKWLLFLYS